MKRLPAKNSMENQYIMHPYLQLACTALVSAAGSYFG